MTGVLDIRPCRRCAADWRHAGTARRGVAVVLLAIGALASSLYIAGPLGLPLPDALLVVAQFTALPAGYIAYLLLVLTMSASGTGFADTDAMWRGVFLFVGFAMLQYGVLARIVLLPRTPAGKDRQPPGR